MDPEVMTKVWRRNVRISTKSTAAMAKDLVHSTRAFSAGSSLPALSALAELSASGLERAAAALLR